MNKLEKAYQLGFDAAENDKECIPFLNSDLCELIDGLAVGEGSIDIMEEFRRGVCDGVEL